MYAFLILLFPIAVFRHFQSGTVLQNNKHTEIAAAWTGAAAAVVISTGKAFLTFSYRVHSALFILEWLHNFFAMTFLPIAFAVLILAVMHRRGTPLPYCVCALFSCLASFFAIYLPFVTLAGPRSIYSAYELFFRPPLYLMMTVNLAACAKLIAAAQIDPQLHLRRMGFSLLSVFMIAPSVIDTLMFMNNQYLIAWLVYMAISFIWYVITASRQRQD